MIPSADGLCVFRIEQTAPDQRTQETHAYLGLYFSKLVKAFGMRTE